MVVRYVHEFVAIHNNQIVGTKQIETFLMNLDQVFELQREAGNHFKRRRVIEILEMLGVCLDRRSPKTNRFVVFHDGRADQLFGSSNRF